MPVASGLFVLISLIVYRIALKVYTHTTTFLYYRNRAIGINVSTLYRVDLILFVGALFCCAVGKNLSSLVKVV